MASLTAERLREIAAYDRETGVFMAKFIRRGSPRRCIGRPMGTQNGIGYIVIRIDGCSYLAHRLAWLYVMGEWPAKGIDHKNSNGSDNRWENLRVAGQVENLQNARKRRDNTSGFKGVRYRANRGHWYATLKLNGRNKYLGSFHDPESAHAAYVGAAERYFGEFARAE